jgi:bifunctional non-homologous end joining protein LigD
MEKTGIKIGRRTVEITHPDKLIFPESGITKAEFVDYYRQIAGVMVPHIQDRPLVMHRFRDSIHSAGFYQQKIPGGAPEWVHTATVKKAGGTVTHPVADDAASLVYLANQDCITLHAWLSRADQPNNPDQMIFDLDPPGEDFEPVRRGARFLKSILDEIGLTAYLKTTGSHGLHIVIPLDRKDNFDSVREFANGIAAAMTREEPEQYTTEQRKEKRRDRLFIDTLRNAYAHTAVAPYSVRAVEGAPVAAPLEWTELDDADLTARKYNIRSVLKRIKENGDPWKDIQRRPQNLEPYRQKLQQTLRFQKGREAGETGENP